MKQIKYDSLIVKIKKYKSPWVYKICEIKDFWDIFWATVGRLPMLKTNRKTETTILQFKISNSN